MITAEELRFQGDIYYKAAQTVASECEKMTQKVIESEYKMNLTEEERKIMFMGFPEHVLYAFGSELYLKSLIIYVGKSYKKEHDFDKLYNVLDDYLKFEIHTEFEKRYDDVFYDSLIKYKDAFERIRYIVENQNKMGLLKFVKRFCGVLHDITENHIGNKVI